MHAYNFKVPAVEGINLIPLISKSSFAYFSKEAICCRTSTMKEVDLLPRQPCKLTDFSDHNPKLTIMLYSFIDRLRRGAYASPESWLHAYNFKVPAVEDINLIPLISKNSFALLF